MYLKFPCHFFGSFFGYRLWPAQGTKYLSHTLFLKPLPFLRCFTKVYKTQINNKQQTTTILYPIMDRLLLNRVLLFPFDSSLAAACIVVSSWDSVLTIPGSGLQQQQNWQQRIVKEQIIILVAINMYLSAAVTLVCGLSRKLTLSNSSTKLIILLKYHP